MAVQYGGEKLKEAGYEKTGKAVGVGGTALKYAGIGGMIGSVVPGVGTAIGAGIGGALGAGKGIYDQYFSDDAKPEVKTAYTKNIEAEMKAQEYQKTHPGLSPQEALEAVKREEAGMVEPNQSFAPVTPTSANTVVQASSDNAMAKMPSKDTANNNIINAPTTISKQTQNTSMKVNIKDQDNTLRSYYRSRFAT